MIWSKQRFQHSFEIYPRVLKEVAPLLLPLSFLIWGMDFTMAYLNKARMDDPYSSSMIPIVIVGISGIFIQAFASVAWILYVARSTQRQAKNGTGEHPWVFLKKNFHQSFIEYIRGFISTGIYTLFLIVPGLIRWTQLIFICLVSAFDSDYQKGKKDALKESSRLVRGHFIGLAFFLVLQMILPFFIEELAKNAQTPMWMTVVCLGISWCFMIYFAIYFSLTFFGLATLKREKA